MAKRMRRFTATVEGVAVTGCRDLSDEDLSEYDRSRGDDEEVGDEVKIGSGGFDVSFELLAPHTAVVSGYVNQFIATGKVLERSGVSETTTSKTYTYEQGHFKVSHSLNTDTPGRVRVQGNFKTRTIA